MKIKNKETKWKQRKKRNKQSTKIIKKHDFLIRLCIKTNNGQICNVIQQSDRVYSVTFLREYIS